MGVARTGKDTSRNSLVELVMIVVVALGLALGIQAFLVKPFRIPSESMVPTLDIGQRVLVDRVSFRFGTPDRGDVVVFKPPKGADENVCGMRHSAQSACPRPTPTRSDTNFIKRVVAVGGDHVKILGGHVILNGRRQPDSYIRPDDQYFMMGDNRGQSADSREWGPVKKDWIIGQAFFTYWPPKRIGFE